MTISKSLDNERFIVCGLGSLGQHCIVALQAFEVEIAAIERIIPKQWETPYLQNFLSAMIVGDCRQNDVLTQARIETCRAALVVTGSEQVNIETALAIRQLNPHTRLIIRSSRANLNYLLSQQLGNFDAYDPTQISTSAFALAALGTGTIGFFSLSGHQLRVVERQITPSDPWCDNRSMYELNNRRRQVLSKACPDDEQPFCFFQWEPSDNIRAGDSVIYIEITEKELRNSPQIPTHLKPKKQSTLSFQPRKTFISLIRHFTQLSLRQKIRKVAIICALIVTALLALGTLFFQWHYPGTTLVSAFYATAILLLGGYSDLFDQFVPIPYVPWWLQLFSLGLTIAGTAFVGVLYALLTETLLSTKFKFIRRRPPIPQYGHIVVIGLGKIGLSAVKLLLQYKQSLVGITTKLEHNPESLPQLPVITGNYIESLSQANLKTAKSIIVASGDEINNIEIALMVQTINPQAHLIIRTAGERLSQHLRQILPNSQIIGANAEAAKAFVGAAFGENILCLFRLKDKTILVTEYHVEEADTLNGLLLGEFAYGYGVLPLLHQRLPQKETLMPSTEIRLSVGDRLVVLGTIESLNLIEQGNAKLELKHWYVHIEKAYSLDSIFDGANALFRIAGINLTQARNLMQKLPQTLPISLYQHQAHHLIQELNINYLSKLILKCNKQFGVG